MAPAQGYAALLGIGTTSTVDKPLHFQNESLKLHEEFPFTEGIRGSRSRHINQVRQGTRKVDGGLTLIPTAKELADLLPWVLGANASGTTFDLAETVQSRYVAVDRVTKVYVYDGVCVNRATFRASQGQPLSLILELMGVDETKGNAGSFPSLTLDVTTVHFRFHDAVISVGGTPYKFRSFECVVDNKLDGERFFNSATRTAIPAQDRQVSVKLDSPLGDNEAIYGLGAGGAAVVATFSSTNVSLAMTFGAVAFPRESPDVEGKKEIFFPLNGEAYKTGSTPELSCALDSTP